jgi:ribosomal-protein-alanine acetyltransferase
MNSPVKKNIYVRPLSEEHLPLILKIQRECRLSPWSEEDYRKEIQRGDSISLASVYESETVGFIVMRLTARGEAEIYNIAISAAYRGIGIGGLLLNEALRKACRKRETKCVWLEVRESNEQASRFYKRNGFSVAGVRKDFYTHPAENALLMKLEIKKSPTADVL